MFDFELTFYVPLDTKPGHFVDVLPSQPLGVVQATEETKRNATEENNAGTR